MADVHALVVPLLAGPPRFADPVKPAPGLTCSASRASQQALPALMVRMRINAPSNYASLWNWRVGLGVTVAAAAATIVVRMPGELGDDQFGARGSGALEQKVGATLYALLPAGAPVALVGNAEVHGDTAFVLGVRNLDREHPLWLLSFAVDAAANLHWLYPRHTSPIDDELAVPIFPRDVEELLPESVILERPAAGGLLVVVLISPTRLQVSTIEGLRTSELAFLALRQRFPDAAISELSLQLVP